VAFAYRPFQSSSQPSHPRSGALDVLPLRWPIGYRADRQERAWGAELRRSSIDTRLVAYAIAPREAAEG
jgi:hypothetical protein